MANKIINNMATEQAVLKLMGQTLQFIWRTGAVKIFTICLMIITFGAFVFSYRVDPMIAFIFFCVFCTAIVVFLMWLLPKHPELFQDSGTWLGYQELLVGHKSVGLHNLPTQTQLVQPTIVQSRNISGKANIISSK